jgi:UDP-N-acetylmuramyl pentapeptide phosphotransferase/UDP-N-acetylglucosamine-1-phosphate transferase
MTALVDLARQGLPVVIAALVSWAVLSLLLRYADRLPLDRPNPRSLHARVVPRGAGLAIWAGWLAGSFWTPGPKTWLFPLLAVIAISLLDDSRGVHIGVRLAVQTAAAALWVWLVSPSVPPLIAVLAIVWMANLYNFMDGSDGLAGTMTVAGFGAYAAAAFYAGADQAGLLLALATATAPFLYQNVPPARVFLGDVGAVPLGFLAAVFGLAGVSEGWWPLWFPLLVFLPFIADASVTLVYRLLRRARIWEAHREHFYQRLVRLGWGHTRTLKLYGGLMLGTASSAVTALVWAPQLGPWLTVGWSAVLALVYGSIHYHWRRRRGQGIDESKC